MKTTIKIIILTILAYSFSACSSGDPDCQACKPCEIQASPYSTYNYTKPQPNQNVW